VTVTINAGWIGSWHDVRELEAAGAPIGTVVADIFGRQFWLRKSSPSSDQTHWSSDNTSFASITGSDRVRVCYLPGQENVCDHTEFLEAQRRLRQIQRIVND